MEGKGLYKTLVEYTHSIDRLSQLGYWVTLDGVFVFTLDCYSEATRCYDAGIIESSIIMCRNAIDSAIFEGVVKELTLSINYAAWNFKGKFGFKEDWWKEWLWASSESKDKVLTLAVYKMRRIGWLILEEEGKNKQLILNEDEAEEISKIRSKGNYSAHRASGITLDLARASKENKADVKIRHSKEQAMVVLEETEKWLEKIIYRYNAIYDKGQII
ncbi:MAG: hypothetical protein KGH60_02390 [Candidatus Micrarchaeota archaeon]|nr:hypothetical protein [Candidatus Micrarchaeota archaeon]